MNCDKYIKRYLMSRAVSEEDFNQYVPEDGASKGPLTVETHEKWLWVKEWYEKSIYEYPVYFDSDLKNRIEGYFNLMEKRPDLFVPLDGKYPLSADRRQMLLYEEANKTKTDRNYKTGLILDNSPFYYVVSDLIDASSPYTYSRVIYPEKVGGTVIVPMFTDESGEEKFLLLENMRHPTRQKSFEFPRGFKDTGLTENANAAKELSEELSGKAGFKGSYISEITKLGEAFPDSGLTSAKVSFMLAKMKKLISSVNTDEEGIKGFIMLSEGALSEKIKSGEIKDGLTQNAFFMYLLNKKEA